uniref:Integral membrane protein MviN n=1 Tax=Paulinella chromatophora TaxID=39717 RepID=B1X4S9_PAUCH|nr:integral membrane protein MviN [Paulinella chromatophora]ACB42948.1 integral membrane protein MviN [Paulinella chromatophora]
MAKSLRRIALVVTLATALSKLLGLLRQQAIAGAFGVSSAYDAYNYAYIFPGFLLILLGGINGPFHSAIVTSIVSRPHKEKLHILAAVNTLTGTVLFGVTGLLWLTSDLLITLVGPGLNLELHKIAVIQLQIMAPIAMFAGFIGLSFGVLNASNEFWLPSVSPLISSAVVISGLGLLWLKLGSDISNPERAFLGGGVLAGTTLLGAIAQWLVQIPLLIKQGVNKISFVWDWSHPGVAELLRVMLPATISSGMLQINVLIDLFFASGIMGSAAALSYAGLLVQTPLGLASSALLVPLLPIFTKLVASKDNCALIDRIRQGLMVSNIIMIPLGISIASLAYPIVGFVYSRGAFDNHAKTVVSTLLMAYGIGMPIYLGRDLVVRIFYALGDGITPLRFSIAGIILNLIFDWILVGGPSPWGLQLPYFNCGTPGLVLATVGVNASSYMGLLIALQSRVNGIPLFKWILDSIYLIFSGILSSLLIWQLTERVTWPNGIVGYLVEIFICGTLGIILYILSLVAIGLPETRRFFFDFRSKVVRTN